MEFKKQEPDELTVPRLIFKLSIFAGVIFLCGILEVSFCAHIRLFDAVPDLVLAMVLGLAVFDGEKTGAVMGIWAGVVSDALGGSIIMIAPLYLMLVGYIAGIAVRTVLGKNLPSWVVLVFVGCLARMGATLIAVAADSQDFNFLTAMSKILLPEFASTFVSALPFYFIARALCRPFHKSIEMT